MVPIDTLTHWIESMLHFSAFYVSKMQKLLSSLSVLILLYFYSVPKKAFRMIQHCPFTLCFFLGETSNIRAWCTLKILSQTVMCDLCYSKLSICFFLNRRKMLKLVDTVCDTDIVTDLWQTVRVGNELNACLLDQHCVHWCLWDKVMECWERERESEIGKKTLVWLYIHQKKSSYSWCSGGFFSLHFSYRIIIFLLFSYALFWHEQCAFCLLLVCVCVCVE